MAKIPVYDAPDRDIHTEREGFAAEETAGRRIGPAFDRAATDVRDIGNVTASIFKQRLWPFDIAELEQNNTGDSGSSGGGKGRGGGGGGGGVQSQGPKGFNDAGAVGRLGKVAAAAAQHFNGTPIAKNARVLQYGDDKLGAGMSKDMDPLHSRIINDNRSLQQGQFPDKVTPGLENRFDPNKDPNATTWPRGKEEQPANPDFLRREAEQGVFREPLGGDYGGGSDVSPQEASSFPSSIWQGVNDAASWLGRQIGVSGNAEASQSQSSYESLPEAGYGLPEE